MKPDFKFEFRLSFFIKTYTNPLKNNYFCLFSTLGDP